MTCEGWSGTFTTTLTGKWTVSVCLMPVYMRTCLCVKGGIRPSLSLSLSVLIKRDSSRIWVNGVAVVEERRRRRRRKGGGEENKEQGKKAEGIL
jgi:hypothetical protein